MYIGFSFKNPPKLKITPSGFDIKAIHFHRLNTELLLKSNTTKTGKMALATNSQGNPHFSIRKSSHSTPPASHPSPVCASVPAVGFAVCRRGGLAVNFWLNLLILLFLSHTDPGKQMSRTPWSMPILTPGPSSFQPVIVPASKEIKRH